MKLKELFETKKQYIIEVDLDQNNYLFIEGLSEFGGTISKRFNIKNIKTFCIELIDKKDGYIDTIDSINVSLESDIQQIKEMGLNQIEKEAKVREITNKIWAACGEGLLPWKEVAQAALKYMSEDEVADMATMNEFFEEEDKEKEKA